MFNKIYKFIFGLLMIVIFNFNITQAQTTTKSLYPIFSISPLGGVQFPVSWTSNIYQASFNVGVDFNLKINRETSFFLKAGYYDLLHKSVISVGPNASFIEISAGPRYTFTSPSIKSVLFLEAGLGVYMFHKQDFTFPDGITEAAATTSNFGINAGPGVIIPLGAVADFIIKSKVHYILLTGGSQTYISVVMGVDFKL